MPYVIEMVTKLPNEKHSKGRGAPYGVVKHKKFLRKRVGEWGCVSNESSKLSARLVADYWRQKFGDEGMEFASRGRRVWARFRPEDILTDAPTMMPRAETVPDLGASVRAPEIEENEPQEYVAPPQPRGLDWEVVQKRFWDDDLYSTQQSLGTYWREYTRRYGVNERPGPNHEEAEYE